MGVMKKLDIGDSCKILWMYWNHWIIYFEIIEVMNFILLEFYLRKKERSMLGFPGGSVIKNPPANAEDLGWIPG